jgi:D-alanine--poly(phosphoribitol) ligase subunit 1
MQALICPPEALAIHRAINQTARPYPRDSSVPARFEYWARRRPEAVAVVQDDRSVSFRQLNQWANGLACDLREAGVGPGGTVGVCIARSPEMLVALLGILKCAATYVPIDPDWPDERVRTVVSDAGCRWLVSDRPVASGRQVADLGCSVIGINEASLWGREVNPGLPVGPLDIACINFTSGSTGRPKGVPIFHRGIIRLVHGATYGPLDEHSRVLQVTPFTFDIATWEIWGALLCGGTSVMHPAEFLRLSRLSRTMRDGRVSILLLTTSLFNSLVDEAPEALSTVGTITTGGEAHSLRHMAKAVRAYGPGRVVNLYGPTECTCTATFFPVNQPPPPEGPLPIGRPIQNTRVYLLTDDSSQLCRPGESGEICLAGDGLAAGYLGMPELTRQVFIHRLIGGTAERLYRTGDRGHLLPGGDLVFDGRRDDQVKVNSYRIELGEITHHLSHHPTVKQSYVTVRDDRGDPSLVAFVVPSGPTITSTGLREHLATKLPRYMVPAQIHICTAFPLTPNGKIDRRALLATCDSSPTLGVSNS